MEFFKSQVKKPKYHNRNENDSSNTGQRKNNPFQQHYNNNYNRSKRPSWVQNGNGYHRKAYHPYNKPYNHYRQQNNNYNNWRRWKKWVFYDGFFTIFFLSICKWVAYWCMGNWFFKKMINWKNVCLCLSIYFDC